ADSIRRVGVREPQRTLCAGKATVRLRVERSRDKRTPPPSEERARSVQLPHAEQHTHAHTETFAMKSCTGEVVRSCFRSRVERKTNLVSSLDFARLGTSVALQQGKEHLYASETFERVSRPRRNPLFQPAPLDRLHGPGSRRIRAHS